MSVDLFRKLATDGAVVAGVLSGTSADGIDVAITRVRVKPESKDRNAGERLAVPNLIGRQSGDPAPSRDIATPELIAFATLPFPSDVRARVRAVLDGERCGLRDAALLSRDLGRAFGRAARDFARQSGVGLDLVGSHGQTVWHHDGNETSGAATLQLGDGDFVADEAGCAVVSDFRQRDIAAGGEGAPVSALADGVLFERVPRPCAILNLGGMANLTVLRAWDDVLAFDTGPANSLLDGLARELLGAPCDRDGASAARGRIDESFVREMCAHPFLAKPPPKSTGRDTFGAPWVGEVLTRARARGLLERGPDDLMATATAFVAHTVALALERWVEPRAQRLVVAGGGVHNRSLMLSLYERCGIPVGSSAAAGVDPDAREALVFAVLAARCVLGVPSTHPGATGARFGCVLGKLSPG
jgi:anhydro-N-acetylmuramic acid kinase